MRRYVLIGYPKDTFDLAEQRLRQMQATQKEDEPSNLYGVRPYTK